MKEVKSPKKPLIYYYLIVLGAILLFSMLVSPLLVQSQVIEVDYGTFVEMAENKELGKVEVNEAENQILFTDKDNTVVYEAGMIPDQDLAQLLKDSGAQYGGQVVKQASPILSFLLGWVLPIAMAGPFTRSGWTTPCSMTLPPPGSTQRRCTTACWRPGCCPAT